MSMRYAGEGVLGGEKGRDDDLQAGDFSFGAMLVGLKSTRVE
jgi:hypothetical protein